MLTAALKPKPCANCQSLFTPARPLQNVCGPVCARRTVDAKKKAEKAADKAKRAEQEPIPKLKAAAQDAFNAWVRMRDAHLPCISCGETDPPMKPGGQWDAGHFLSRGAYPELRFDEDNCHKQCKSCNGGGGKFAHKARTVAAEYEERLIARIGVERVERLKGPHDPVKWDRDTLRQVKTIYRAKYRDLKKGQA